MFGVMEGEQISQVEIDGNSMNSWVRKSRMKESSNVDSYRRANSTAGVEAIDSYGP